MRTLFLILFLTGTIEAISFTQGASSASVTNTVSISTAFPTNVSRKNLLVVAFQAPVSVTETVSDSMGNQYTQAHQACFGTADRCLTIVYATARDTGPNTVTLTTDSPSAKALYIHEYSNDLTRYSCANGGGFTSSSLTSGNFCAPPYETLIFGFGTVLSGTMTKGASFTQRIVTTSAPVIGMTEDKVVTSAGNYNVDFSNSGVTAWVCAGTSFFYFRKRTDVLPMMQIGG